MIYGTQSLLAPASITQAPATLQCSPDAQPDQHVCRYNLLARRCPASGTLPAQRSALAPLFQRSAAPALGCSGAAISVLGRSGSWPFECLASPALSFSGTRPLSLDRSATPAHTRRCPATLALGHSDVRTLRCSVAPVTLSDRTLRPLRSSRSGPSFDRSGPRPLWSSAALSLGRSVPRPLWSSAALFLGRSAFPPL